MRFVRYSSAEAFFHNAMQHNCAKYRVWAESGGGENRKHFSSSAMPLSSKNLPTSLDDDEAFNVTHKSFESKRIKAFKKLSEFHPIFPNHQSSMSSGPCSAALFIQGVMQLRYFHCCALLFSRFAQKQFIFFAVHNPRIDKAAWEGLSRIECFSEEREMLAPLIEVIFLFFRVT